MNTPENNPMSTPANEEVQVLKQQVSMLRQQLVVVVVMTIVLNLSLDFYLYKQFSMVRWQRSQLQNEYQQKTAMQMHETVKKLREFGALNPDYNQVLSQYVKMTNPPSFNAPQPTTTPATSKPVVPSTSPKRTNP